MLLNPRSMSTYKYFIEQLQLCYIFNAKSCGDGCSYKNDNFYNLSILSLMLINTSNTRQLV